MRLLLKLAMKLMMMVGMVLLMGWAMRNGSSLLTHIPGAPSVPGMETPKFSSEEADLMSTVFKSALRLFTGQAKRDELASELSDKLYAGRAGAGEMAELGIELVKPNGSTAPPGVEGPTAGGPLPHAQTGTQPPNTPPAAQLPNGQPAPATTRNAKPGNPAKPGLPGLAPAPDLTKNIRTDLLGRIWDQTRKYSIEMGLVPVVFLGMVLYQRIRRRRSAGDEFFIPTVGIMPPAESEHYDMKHHVHGLGAEDFEMLVALIYQRQGYRLTMPAGLSGGRGGDFTLLRKSEKILVQCKKLSLDHRVPVERVRELHEAMTAQGAPRGLYVVSCGFTWDARNFAKTRGITLINARTLDELLLAARETPTEDLLAIAPWVPKLLTKVQITPPHCPACEAAMDQVTASNGAVWVCSQRPDCRGRRSARKYQKPAHAPARQADPQAEGVKANA